MFKSIFCLVLVSVLTAYFHFNRGDISFFARNNFILCGISTAVFRVSNSSDAFRLNKSGKAKFLSAVQTICRFGNFI